MARRTLPLLLAVAGAAAGARQPVSLEAVLARPEPGLSASWAPDGTRFVYRDQQRLMLYELKARAGRLLADLDPLERSAAVAPPPKVFPWVNRGVREQAVQWSADSSRLLLLLKGDLFLVDAATGRADQLTKTAQAERDPKLSPDGRMVSFRLEHDLYTLEIGSRKLRRLTRDGSDTLLNAELDWVYPEELALGTAHWWSPDSRRIAYLQFDVSPVQIYPHAELLALRPFPEPQRYPQAGTPNSRVRLGVVSAAGGRTRWLPTGDPADSLLARVAWLPASSTISLHRLNRIQNRLEVLLFDAGSGRERRLLEESAPTWINLKDDWKYLSGSPRLLAGSERGGWRHLYLHDLSGGQPRALTSGDWEVADLACVDEPNQRVYYVSTEASPLERHLYSVAFDGAGKTRLSRAAGTHTVNMAPDCRHYLDTHSSIEEPSQTTLHSTAADEPLAVLRERNRKTQETWEILPTEFVRFKGKDGTEFHCRLIRPAGFTPGRKYPAIVMVYGGPHAQSVRNAWRGADWDQLLAHRGFVIWQVDNRGSAFRGHPWEAVVHRRLGRQELADQLEGLDYLESLGFVDSTRIGLYGWSYGGYMTLYSLLNAPGRFRAGIAGAPVTDWRQYDTIYTERYMGLPSENEEGYRLSSPVNNAASLQAKLMLVHNSGDDNVLFQHTFRMIDALERAGKQFDLLLYPQKSHGVTGPVRRHMLEAMTAFFERHLK